MIRMTALAAENRSTSMRDKMSSEQISQLREAMQNMLGGREPRDFQIEMVQAQEEGQDALCHAATGSGKTAIAAGPYALAKNQGRITFMVSPLIGLQNEMVRGSLLSSVNDSSCFHRSRPSKRTSISQL
jgi:superfamily II RNA helicase